MHGDKEKVLLLLIDSHLLTSCRINEPNVVSGSNRKRRGMVSYCATIGKLICDRIADEAPNPTSNIANEGIPKSISRVLDATKIRSEFKAIVAKRKREQDEGSTTPAPKKKKLAAGGSKLVITPGESLAHFNRCSAGSVIYIY